MKFYVTATCLFCIEADELFEAAEKISKITRVEEMVKVSLLRITEEPVDMLMDGE